MALLRDEDVQLLKEAFEPLTQPVTVTVVTRERSALVLPGAEEEPGDASAEVKEVLGEVIATSAKLTMQNVDARDDADRARALVGERTPAFTLSSPRTKGKLRYFGLPAGYEMSTVVQTILDIGTDEEVIPADVAERLQALAKPVHIQVFVTPS